MKALETAMATERSTIQRTEKEKDEIQAEIDASAENITDLQEDLKALNDVLETATKGLDVVKKDTSKSSKVLDQALKDIASKVWGLYILYTRAHNCWCRTMKLKSLVSNAHQSTGDAGLKKLNCLSWEGTLETFLWKRLVYFHFGQSNGS